MLKQIFGGRRDELWTMNKCVGLHNPRTPHTVAFRGNPKSARASEQETAGP